MTFTECAIKMPEQAVQYVENSDETMMNEQRALMMYPYIKNGVLSHGRVAELLGMNKFELVAIYERFGIPFISMSWNDVEADVKNCFSVMNKTSR